MVTMRRALALVLVACQGHGSTTEPPAGSATPHVDATSGAGFGSDDAALAQGSDDTGSARPKLDEPELPPDPSKVIAELGAIPAWQAVVDRADLLARRDQHGVVYGVLGGPIMVPGPTPEPTDAGVRVDAGVVASKYTWFIDDTDGNGSLAIHVDLAGKQLAAGDRVALGGAWVLDEAREWVWKVDAVSPLPAAVPSGLKEPPSPPGHVIADGNFPPGAKMISFAKDDDAVIFQLDGPAPSVDGDGWPVADQLGSPVAALLNLPGERPSYGAQDMRTPDEHWTLKRGQTYWVRIGKLHKRGPDKPVVMNARTAPVRVK
jgi:hypothetical protein